jgi:hypothetical protein
MKFYENGNVLTMPGPGWLKIPGVMGYRTAAAYAGSGFFFLLLLLSSSFAASAPPQIQNKTVTASWSVDYTLVAPDGKILTPTVRTQRVIYVSSAGRFFIKYANAAAGGSESGETAPGGKTPSGGARDVRFEGGKIVAMAVLQGGAAGRMVISFDPGYSTCTVDAVIGRSGRGPTTMRRHGVLLEVRSQSISGQSCSVREGNAFANQ